MSLVLCIGVNDISDADQETYERFYLLCPKGKGFWEIFVK